MINLKRLLTPFSHFITNAYRINTCNKYNFAMMALFQKNKSPQQLSPVFQKPKRIKGHLKSKHRKGYISPKLNKNTNIKPLRLKNHQGLLKRIKIVGPRWNRQFKRLHAERYHLRRKKSSANLRRKKRAAYVSKPDMRKVKKLIPYFKRKSLKNQY